MADNKESFQESLMIKRAKRRLLGALSILISLFVLSIFFLQDRTEINSKNSIKISFIEIDTNNYHAEKSYDAQDKLTQDMKSPIIVKKLSNFSRDESIEDGLYFIQVGIFSDEDNASKLLSSIKSLGYDARLELIQMSGKEKLKLTTTAFNSQTEAQFALSKFKSANLPGIIKQE